MNTKEKAEYIRGHMDDYDFIACEVAEEYLDLLDKMEIIKNERVTGCDICGGKLATIRGRYPGMEDREVCTTCLAETLDHIRDRLNDNYNRPQAND